MLGRVIVHLNGWPGVGKLTVGWELAAILGARLVDNHAISNTAASLCARGTDAYRCLYRQVRDIAYARMLKMPSNAVFVMTNSLTREISHDVEAWAEIRQLSADRTDILVAVTLECDLMENLRRLQAVGRILHRKLVDPEPLMEWRTGDFSLEKGELADHYYIVNSTRLTPRAAAEHIVEFLKAIKT
jgi:hypothetical protein